MAASEVASLSGIILQIASSIQNAGNNWYKASADWTDFPRRVEHFRRKHDFWLAKLTEYGLLSDTSLVEALRGAEVPLREEQARLSRKQSKFRAKWVSKLSMMTFPARIGLRMQRVIDGFDAIMGQLDLEQKAELALESRVLRRAPSLAIRTDSRYVPLTISEAQVSSALDDPLCPPVVLLHGFPGTGKSTLARQTALHYNNAAKSDRFERVVFLECGRDADLETTQFDLLQQLGPTALQEQLNGERSSATTIQRRLSNFLKHQKLLIILDDVWDREFLRRMVDLCGVDVRYLVTSQRADLCQGCSFSVAPIQIEDPDNKSAMEILASHVGFRNKEIPSRIQELAKKMIQDTQGHPLALATIATAIDFDRSDDLEEWASVYDNFFHALQSTEDTASVLGNKHSKCLWTTLELSFQSLGVNAQTLLILVHMCAGPSVPEEVLEGLHTRAVLQAGFETFKKSRKELQSRDLIKITSLHNGRSWSTVAPLLKVFIEVEMRDRTESMLTVLVPVPNSSESAGEREIDAALFGDNNVMIQRAICALYLEKPLSETAASSLDIPSYRLNDLRRNAIEPITRLLWRTKSKRWTVASEASSRQVFWAYISNGALHNGGILHLLASPISTLPMLTALSHIASLEVTLLLDSNSQGFIKALSNLLEDQNTSNVTIAMAAARAILQFSLNRSHVEVLISCGISDVILKMFSCEYHPDIEETLLEIFGNVGSCTVRSAEMILLNPGSLALVVKSLSRDNNYNLLKYATGVLDNLAASDLEKVKRTIIQFPGLLEQLIRLMSKDTLPELQEQGTRALHNLANGLEMAQRTIIGFPGALEQLIGLLSKDTVPALQQEATTALYYLAELEDFGGIRVLARLAASKAEGGKLTIIQSPGALEQLIGLLSKDALPELQQLATSALSSLAASELDEVKCAIIQFPGALAQLIRLLSKDTVPAVQQEATRALYNLKAVELEEVKRKSNQYPVVKNELLRLYAEDCISAIKELSFLLETRLR